MDPHKDFVHTLHLRKTKCAALIKNVIPPLLLADLIKDIGSLKYPIITDEPTDVSTEKLLSICAKYNPQSKNDIVTEFLAFVSVVITTANDLFSAFVEYLKNLIYICKILQELLLMGHPIYVG